MFSNNVHTCHQQQLHYLFVPCTSSCLHSNRGACLVYTRNVNVPSRTPIASNTHGESTTEIHHTLLWSVKVKSSPCQSCVLCARHLSQADPQCTDPLSAPVPGVQVQVAAGTCCWKRQLHSQVGAIQHCTVSGQWLGHTHWSVALRSAPRVGGRHSPAALSPNSAALWLLPCSSSSLCSLTAEQQLGQEDAASHEWHTDAGCRCPANTRQVYTLELCACLGHKL